MIIFASNNYKDILSVFNEKRISKTIGQFWSLNNEDYFDIIINLLQDSNENEIIKAIKPYLLP